MTERGGPASHTAIVARQLGIPAVVGIGSHRFEGIVDVDAGAGEVRAAGEAIELRDPVDVPPDVMAAARSFTSGRIAITEASLPFTHHEGATVGLIRMERIGVPADLWRPDSGFVELRDALIDPLSKMVEGSASIRMRLADLQGNEHASRGVAPMLRYPHLVAAQVDALAAALERSDGDPQRISVVVPYVSVVEELDWAIDAVRAQWAVRAPCELHLGVMVETPRAALIADQFAARVDELCVGTNDLTALTFGWDREDVQVQAVTESFGVVNPFAHLDQVGVARLIGLAVELARAARPDIHVVICGVHAEIPEAIAAFLRLGVNELVVPADGMDLAVVHAAQAIARAER